LYLSDALNTVLKNKAGKSFFIGGPFSPEHASRLVEHRETIENVRDLDAAIQGRPDALGREWRERGE
jgi:hypothetical protein